MTPNSDASETPTPQTTMHVQRAVRGDASSLDWVIEHLTPLLIAQAKYRLGPALRRDVDAEDLVSGAWVIALPRLGALCAREGRITPVLLKFLSTSITLQIKRLLSRRAHVARRVLPVEDPEAFAAIANETRGTPTRVAKNELEEKVRESIDQLPPTDREVLVLRGIEQHPAKDVAEMLDISPPAVDQRYSRALKRLREKLPRSIFDELGDE